MDDFSTFVSNYFTYLALLVVALGLWKWQILDVHFRVAVVKSICSGSIGILSSHYKSDFWFFLNGLVGVLLFAIFFQGLLKGVFSVLIWLWAGLIVIILVGAFLVVEIDHLQLYVFIPYDFFIITFCLIYISKHLEDISSASRKPLLLLVMVTLSDFCFNLGLDIITHFLTSYLSDSFINLLWDGIVPLYIVLSIGFTLWIFISVRPKIPELTQMPDLER